MDKQTLADLRRYLDHVAPEEEGGLETLASADGLESLESIYGTDEEKSHARRGLERMREGTDDLSLDEFEAIEAIILPGKRPVVDIVDDGYGKVPYPFSHLGSEQYRKSLEPTIPSIGRIELPMDDSVPYGGTGFVVGDGVLMTNRHVARLFADGVGARDLSFQPGQTAAVDFKKERASEASHNFEIKRILMIHPYWDMALLEVEGLDVPALTLSVAQPEGLDGREVAVIGYPALDPRNKIDLQNRIFHGVFNVKRMQPGKLRNRESIQSFGHAVSAITHDSSTLGGNSGSAVVDVNSGEVLSLHFAGRYLKANYAVPSHELARDSRVVDAGVRFAGDVVSGSVPWVGAWQAADGAAESTEVGGAGGAQGDVAVAVAQPLAQTPGQAATWTIPIEVSIRVGGAQAASVGASTDAAPGGDRLDAGDLVEKLVEPFHEEDYTDRAGYDDRFLGRRVRLPRVLDMSVVSRLDDGEHVIPYEHFSLVMHKERRLAIYTASNVDARPESKRPDARRKYTRKVLSGLGKNDQEKWFTDPRIPAIHQLPDRFFTRDRKSFDKGHVVRRDDVAWGSTYDEVRRANGDTYHVTNCSPQVKDFNRSNLRGEWGKLENLILDQSESEDEIYTVFAGPVLSEDDPVFRGRDLEGETFVQIPQQYWKVVVARPPRRLQTFAFLLDQDLSDTDLEFAVDAAWQDRMISIPDLEDLLGLLRFPRELRDSDQFDTDLGESVRREGGIERVEE